MNKPWWKSLTIWAGVLYAVAKAAEPLLPPAIAATIEPVATATSAIMAAVGGRRAIAKNGNGQ